MFYSMILYIINTIKNLLVVILFVLIMLFLLFAMLLLILLGKITETNNHNFRLRPIVIMKNER
jgi:uncharacterized BrkB/YihY/UPF0761 family membrane protein